MKEKRFEKVVEWEDETTEFHEYFGMWGLALLLTLFYPVWHFILFRKVYWREIK